MDATFGTEMAALAEQLIGDYGTSIVLTHKVTAYAPSTGVMTTTETTQAVKGVVRRFSSRWWGNASVQLGDLEVMLAANTLTNDPVTGDLVTIDGQVYSIVEVSRQLAQDAKVGWVLQVRK